MINLLASMLYIVRFFKKHKKILSCVLWGLGIFLFLFFFVSENLAITLLVALLQLAFAAVFMIGQFVFLFMFLSRSKTITVLPGEGGNLTLKDYRGQKVLVKYMEQWVTILKGDKQFKEMGGEPPRGLLLIGPPGTGKTYLMKALTGEAGIAMHAQDGSSFRAMFWGVDVLKVMGFCNKARNLAMEYGSCIAYLDEIDAIAASRGGVLGGGGGQGQFTGPMGFSGGTGALSTLLTQMDGIGEEREWTRCQNIIRKGFGMRPLEEGFVFFVGATNRPDVLDPAIVRPGRLDKHLEVSVPDGEGRKDIFEYYLGKIKHEEINIDEIVAFTHGATPAGIAMAVTRDAVRNARFDDRTMVNQKDLDYALLEQATGLANPIGDMPKDQKWQVAVHEAGHAVAAHHLRKDKLVGFVSIVRRGAGILGFMLPVERQSTYAMPLRQIVSDVQISLAGDTATKVILEERWTGAASDIEHVRRNILNLAWHGVFGGIVLKQDGDLPENIQKRVQTWIEEQWANTEDFCIRHRNEIEKLATALMEHEELSGPEIIKVLEEQ